MNLLTLVIGLIVGLVLGPAAHPAQAGSIPRTTRNYQVRVLELETGAPVSGATVRIQENVTTRYCFQMEDDVCFDCHPRPEWQVRQTETGADGTASTDFSLPWCLFIDDDPPTWIKKEHLSWETPTIVENPAEGEYSPWLAARIINGPQPFDHTIYVTAEGRLADRFAPVLHQHRGLEQQEDLGDVTETLDEHATLSVYSVLGQQLAGPASMPPYHLWDGHFWDTFGRGTTPVWTRIDIDDDWRYRGGAVGGRPLYYHVFPHDSGVVVQYWLWFNCNDTRAHEESQSMHEGDWECAAIYLTHDGTDWSPQSLNLTQHAGGEALLPDDVWWSATASPSYFDLEPGYTTGRSHPHLWVAANSHALYSRFQPQYRLAVDLLGCQVQFHDRVDYNHGDNPHGEHGFFEWDRLVDMGEYWYGSEAHNEPYFSHTFGGPLEWLAYRGRFGESFCVDLPGCGVDCDFPFYDQRSWAPVSPLVYEDPHLWRDYEHTIGHWGNEVPAGAEVSWVEAFQIGNYLGRYSPCLGGVGDTIRTRVAGAPPGIPGVAQISVLSGSVEFAQAIGGQLSIPASSDGWYELQIAEVEGVGTVRFDIYPEGQPGTFLAENLTCEIGPCGTSDVAPAMEPNFTQCVRIAPNPTLNGARFDFSGIPPELHSWAIHDATGRRIMGGRIPGGRAPGLAGPSAQSEPSFSIRWSGQDSDGRAVPSGKYFLRLTDGTRSHQAGSITVTR